MSTFSIRLSILCIGLFFSSIDAISLKNLDKLRIRLRNVISESIEILDPHFMNFFITPDGKKIPMFEYEKASEKENDSDTDINMTPEPLTNGIISLEKPATTQADFDFIKKTVKEKLLAIKLERFLTEKSKEQYTKLGVLLLNLTATWLEFRYNASKLYSCPCMEAANRIILALTIINDAQQKFKNRNEKLVYTSLASGALLQDYLILKELLKEFTNVEINLIDIGYLTANEYQILPQIQRIADLKEQISRELKNDLYVLATQKRLEWITEHNERAFKHANFIFEYMYALSAHSITQFKELIVTIRPNTTIRIFDSAYSYIRRLAKNPDEKTNILVLTDPNVGFFGIESYPKDSNVLVFWQNNINPLFILFMPHNNATQLIQLKSTLSDPLVNKLKCALIDILIKTGADKKYTPKLVEELLKHSFIEKTVNEIKEEDLNKKLAEAKFLVIKEIAKSFPKLLNQKLDNDLIKFEEEEEEEEEEEKATGTDLQLPASFELLEVNGNKTLISFGSDAYIAFYDLIKTSLATQNIVYTLDFKDQTEDEEYDDVVTKINIEDYIKVDIVTTKSNRTYVTGKIGGTYNKNSHYSPIKIVACSTK